MEMARYLVTAVEVEKRSVRAVATEHGVSKSWLYELLARYRQEGDAGLVARSRRPLHSPTKVSERIEDEIVQLRKELTESGYDAGPETIGVHLARRHDGEVVASYATIWRVLKAKGFVAPQPHKRPRSSYIRFCADLPNERWQLDVTHIRLAGGLEVEVLNVVDDHSRLCVASRAHAVFTATKVVDTFTDAALTWGYPETVLSDNGAVFTAAYRGGVGAFEAALLGLGILLRHSRPYHPQTCGKVERFHQTMKLYLQRQDPPVSIRQLQAQLDTFATYYNEVRPHRAIGRRTPAAVFAARVKASPKLPPIDIEGYRVRQDVVDPGGTVTLRYLGKLRHLGLGRAHAGARVLLLVAGADVRVLTLDGTVIQRMTIDPSRDYQRQVSSGS